MPATAILCAVSRFTDKAQNPLFPVIPITFHLLYFTMVKYVSDSDVGAYVITRVVRVPFGLFLWNSVAVLAAFPVKLTEIKHPSSIPSLRPFHPPSA